MTAPAFDPTGIYAEYAAQAARTKPAETFEWEGRQWCVQHPETCLSDRGGLVTRECPFCADGAR